MQLLEIVLYGYNGRKRVLPLRPGQTNIITGDSKTGKSALIDIVDYCLGRSECTVPDGVIREQVAWYGILIQFASEQIFVARQNPPKGHTTTSRAFLIQGNVVQSPDTAPAEPNTTSDAIELALTRKLGIAPNLHTPAAGQTRLALEANIRHAILYCFQQQNVIANKSILFHRQNEPFMPMTIKDTLPYFLGAVREDRLALEQQLRLARRDVKLAQRLLDEAAAVQGEGLSRALVLLGEARQVGLIAESATPESVAEAVALLQNIANWTPDEVNFSGAPRLAEVQANIRNAEADLGEKTNNLRAVRTYASEAEGYVSEAREQELRLESIGLFNSNGHNGAICPLCSQDMQTPVPHATAIRHSLEQLRAGLDATMRERPRLREYIANLETEIANQRLHLFELREEANVILRESDVAQNLRDLNVRRGRVAGRISLWLESVDQTDETSPLRERLARAERRAKSIVDLLSTDKPQERIASILSRLMVQMTAWSDQLQLEHSGNPVRLDLSRLTLMIDRADRSIPLNNVGSGENWVGAHLISHLALHKHFRANARPVPGFLFLDQPTQVFYPADQSEEDLETMVGIKDEDREKVALIFNLIFDTVESLAPDFQVIITDHADILGNARFQAAVVQKWRRGNKLVPVSWLDNSPPIQ